MVSTECQLLRKFQFGCLLDTERARLLHGNAQLVVQNIKAGVWGKVQSVETRVSPGEQKHGSLKHSNRDIKIVETVSIHK